MKKVWLVLAFALTLTLFFALADYGGIDTPSEIADEKEDEKEVEKEENPATDEAKELQQVGEINATIYSAPGGQFNPIFYGDAYEAKILDFTHEGLTQFSASLEWEPALAKSWDFNEEFTELTYTLNKNVKWHDGEEFTADDVVFTFTTIADPRYTAAGGVRVDYVNQLVGYKEYVAGEADTLVGVEAVDPYTVKFTFVEPSTTALKFTAFSIIPEHIFEGVAVEDMPEHPASIEAGQIVGTGPFILAKIQGGEEYVLEAFAEYWQGEPELDRIVWKVDN